MEKENKKNQNTSKNSIQIIKPYSYAGTWVFDDERTGLIREPFVDGADDIIDVMVKNIPNAGSGFKLIFSENEFPNFQIKLERMHEEFDGWWYVCKVLGIEGWLCPALFHYFDEAPLTLFASFHPIS